MSIANTSPRASTYYWKCDRPAAFHGTSGVHQHDTLAKEVKSLAENHIGLPVELLPGPGQGNHITFIANGRDDSLFIRIDDSPECDDYLAIESHVQESARALGIPTPEILAVDATRTTVSFAWQIMRRIDAPDINQHFKAGTLDLRKASETIGAAIARWQAAPCTGYGPFRSPKGVLEGWHNNYSDYFLLHFDRHLHYLEQQAFLSTQEITAIRKEVAVHEKLLDLQQGCLVHKDLAFWNILGSPQEIFAFIDWDDSISGDPMDDLSLLACFHGAQVIEPTLAAYQSQRDLPEEHGRRFWLHLLRNMIVKSVIRVGAGYFNRNSGFFLINDGVDLQTFTHQRLFQALDGLRGNHPFSTLK